MFHALRLPFLWCACLTPSLAHAQLTPPPEPVGNTSNPAKVALGKALFWEEQMSSTGTVACGTCHSFATGGTDPRAGTPGSLHPGPDGIFGNSDDVWGSQGVILHDEAGLYQASPLFGLEPQVTPRKALTAVGASFAPRLFWDLRAGNAFKDPDTGQILLAEGAALESQAVNPPRSDVEMSHILTTSADVVARLQDATPLALATDIPASLATHIAGKGYPQLFTEAFDSPGITLPRIAMAIAAYERSLIPNEAKVLPPLGDFTESEARGAVIFEEAAGRCATCHPSPLDSDFETHHTGVTDPILDPGLGGITGLPEDMGHFKTPVLVGALNEQRTYFHDGSAKSLEEVIEFYDRGGNFPGPQNELVPLGLNAQQKADLLAYLKTFTDQRVINQTPPFDRPTLYTENPARVPGLYGVGTPSPGAGSPPAAIAVEPPHAQNENFTLGLKNAVGTAAPVWLLLGTEPDPNPNGTQIGGITYFVNLQSNPPPIMLPVGTLSVSASGEGYKSANFTFNLGADPGDRFYAQWIISPDNPVTRSASEAIEIVVF